VPPNTAAIGCEMASTGRVSDTMADFDISGVRPSSNAITFGLVT